MICFPNAKINLGLNIIKKRSDGFHNIESIFYPIDLCDTLEIIESSVLKFSSTGINIPGNSNDNLCLKAYQLIKQDFDIPVVHIHLHKHIPIGAGIGGGSADGAFMINLLNNKFELNISNEQREIYAGKLGSDCPFFIDNKPKHVTGRGELLTPIEIKSLKDKYILVVNPNLHISTAEAYSGVTPCEPEFNLKKIILEPIENWKDALKNDFEDSVFPNYPEIKNLKNTLYKNGASYASMTGSGSTVFGIFDKEPVFENIPNQYFVWKSKF